MAEHRAVDLGAWVPGAGALAETVSVETGADLTAASEVVLTVGVVLGVPAETAVVEEVATTSTAGRVDSAVAAEVVDMPTEVERGDSVAAVAAEQHRLVHTLGRAAMPLEMEGEVGLRPWIRAIVQPAVGEARDLVVQS